MAPADRAFWSEDGGAVTVDWVVLSAIAMTFGAFTVLELSRGTTDIAGTMETTLVDLPVEPLGVLSAVAQGAVPPSPVP